MNDFDLTRSAYYVAVSETLKRMGFNVLPDKFKLHYDTVVEFWRDRRKSVKDCAARILEFGYMESKKP